MKPPRPLFLARAAYRRRRLRDAARLLPVFGVFLVLLPILWTPVAADRDTATDGIYLFAVWFLLIVVAALFARPLRREIEGPAPAVEDED